SSGPMVAAGELPQDVRLEKEPRGARNNDGRVRRAWYDDASCKRTATFFKSERSMAGTGDQCDPAMMELFRAELDTHLPVLSEGLLALEKEGRQPKRLEAMMRAAHSIKGAARIVGVEVAVKVAHVLEDCFVAAQKGEVHLDAGAIDVLLRGVDFLTQVTQPAARSEETNADVLEEVVRAIAAVQSGSTPVPRLCPGPVTSVPPVPAAEPATPACNQAVLQEFVNEAREHLATVGADLLALEKVGVAEARDGLDRLFRAMHSVKGGAGLVGCRQIGAVAHALETILGEVRQGRRVLQPGMADTLLAGSDLIQTLLDDIENSDRVDIRVVLDRLEACLAAPVAESPPVTATAQGPEAAPGKSVGAAGGGGAAERRRHGRAGARSAHDAGG